MCKEDSIICKKEQTTLIKADNSDKSPNASGDDTCTYYDVFQNIYIS